MIKLLLRSKRLELDIRKTTYRFLLALLVPVSLMVLAGCSSEDLSYLPLEEGHWREYQETLVIRDESHARRRIVRNLQSVTIEDKKLFVQESQGGERQFFSIREEGVFRVDLEENESELIMPLSPDQKDSWSLTSRLGVIESRTFALEDRILTRPRFFTMNYVVISMGEEVIVPAGRFKNCLKVKGTGLRKVSVDRHNAKADVHIESVDWYAPGVGLIKTERTERSDSTFLKPGFYTSELLKID